WFQRGGRAMGRVKEIGFRIKLLGFAWGFVILIVLSAPAAWSQGTSRGSDDKPKLSEAEKDRRLEEVKRSIQKLNELASAGKLDEATARGDKILAIRREVLGQLHEEVVNILRIQARLQERREDWAAARATLKEVIWIRERQPDRKDWRSFDARRALADLERR